MSGRTDRVVAVEGLRDVANLSWKLDLVLRAVAAPELLRSYEEERRALRADALDLAGSEERLRR